MKIISVIGARPQFIKSAAFSKKNSDEKLFKEIIIHTGQHYDKNMSKIFFDQLSIPKPKYNLDINNKNHGEMTGEMMIKLESLFIKENPKAILVYGDTNSTLAGALVAKKLKITLVHIESGLRSNNLEMPEEINRIVTDNISNILFCPSQESFDNLKNENITNRADLVKITGDIMYDSLKLFSNLKNNKFTERNNKYCIVTIHREENTDNIKNLKNIVESINKISKFIDIIFPIHPRTLKKVQDFNLDFKSKVYLISPVGYVEMLHLVQNCEIVLTDSGGLQKEAYYLKKFCITLRKETEWKELVSSKVNYITGSNKEKILESFHKLINKDFNSKKNIYGSGNSSEIILKSLKSHFKI